MIKQSGTQSGVTDMTYLPPSSDPTDTEYFSLSHKTSFPQRLGGNFEVHISLT